MKSPINIEKFEHMEYICDKIIHVTKFENFNIYTPKLRLWMEFLGEIFYGVWSIDIHKLNLEYFKILKFLDEIPFKKCVFFHLFNNECIIISFFMKNHYHIK